MSNDWSQQLADELHKPITKNFSKRKVISNGIDKIWAADLVEMQKFSKWNRGIKYLLMVIDVCSKYGWIAALKDKKTESVSKAFNEIFEKSKRKPSMLWTDKGSEFVSKHFKEFLKKEKITLYHTENEEKSSVVERWNRTMKNRMWEMFTANNNTVYWDKLDKLVDDYNNTKHSSVKMTPNEASKKENEEKVFVNLYGDLIYWKPKNQSVQLVIKFVYQNIRDEFLIKVTHQTGQRKYLSLIKYYQPNLLLILLLIQWVKKLRDHFMKKNFKKPNNKHLE